MILDTNAVSALLAGDPGLEKVIGEEDAIFLPVIVLGEYRYGLARSRHRVRLGRLLDLLADELRVLRIDQETSRHYAEVREQLRRDGRPIPENDVWIAALALQHAVPVVSRDTHFDSVDAITRLDW